MRGRQIDNEKQNCDDKNLSITDQNDKDFVFCGNWHCTCFDCLRHHSHEPFNVIIRERKWTNESGKCEGKMIDG